MNEASPLASERPSRAGDFFSRRQRQAFAWPYIIWMAIFVVVPIALIAVYAFTNASKQFTLENFAGMTSYAAVFGRSLWLAFIATAVCLLLGYPVALAISKTDVKT